MTRLSILLLFTLFFLATFSLRFHKHKDHFYKNAWEAPSSPFLNKYSSSGNVIPMDGGLLTLGAYYFNISIGTPPVEFNVLFDTGSANLVVGGIDCPQQFCSNTTLFNPASSSSFSYVDFTDDVCQACSPESYFGNTSRCVFGQPFINNGACGFGITYGGGSSGCSGNYGQDIVCLSEDLCQPAYVGLLNRQYPSNSFTTSPVQGIIGFTFLMNACNPSCIPPILDSVVSTHSIPNLFGVCINEKSGGSLDIGAIDTSKFEQPLVYTKVVSERWWNIQLLEVLVGEHSVNIQQYFYSITNDVIGTFVDSGTSVLLFDPVAYAGIKQILKENYSSLPGISGPNDFFSGGSITRKEFEEHKNEFPSLYFVFPNEAGGNFTLSVPPSSYMMGSENLTPGIQSATSIAAILGDVFMENYYVVFDEANARLGFSPIVSC